MEHRCCMKGCEEVNPVGDCRVLYSFPLELNLLYKWVESTGVTSYLEDFTFAGAQPFFQRRVCSYHFTYDDFLNPHDFSEGLKRNAIPMPCYSFGDASAKQLAPTFEKEIVHCKQEPLEYNDALVPQTELINDVDSAENNTNCNYEYLLPIKTEETLKNEANDEIDQWNAEQFETTQNETEDKTTTKRKQAALTAYLRRQMETEDQKRERRMKNALRASFRRLTETPEQKELRRKKDMLRAQRKRQQESEEEARIRKYNDAVRAAFRRNNETDEQRNERRMKDIMRAHKKRSQETPEEREERLRKDRERASKRRMVKKLTEQFAPLSSCLPIADADVPGTIDTADDAVYMDRLKHIFDIIENKQKENSVDVCTNSEQNENISPELSNFNQNFMDKSNVKTEITDVH